jgi:hypothetical protein
MLNLRNIFFKKAVFKQNNFNTFQKFGLFERLKEKYNKMSNKIKSKDEQSDDEGADIGFKKFTDYILEREQYKWNDYEAQIEVILFF